MRRPPNLRFSDRDEDCSNCRAFKPNSQTCAMFDDYPVAPELLCDDWEAGENAPVKTDGETDEHEST